MSHYVFASSSETNEVIQCRGGILGDIMGNGKTVTAIAVMYHNLPTHVPLLMSMLERDVYLPSRATLVVCPTNIVTQWESEIYKCLGPECRWAQGAQDSNSDADEWVQIVPSASRRYHHH